MAIRHCEVDRKATTYWLHSADEMYRWQVLALAVCPGCKQTVMEVHGFTWDFKRGPTHRILTKQHPFWRDRLKYHALTDAEYQDFKARKGAKEHGKPVVGDFTLLICKDPSKDRYRKQILSRA